MSELMWIGVSGNAKTGPIPQCWVGRTEDETLRSCKASGCTLWDKAACRKRGVLRCYYWAGRPAVAKRSLDRAGKMDSARYSLERALDERRASARHVRLGAGGDHVVAVRETLDAIATCVREGLGILGYTHAWRQARAKSLRGWLMASCESLADVDVALERGWCAAVILPKEMGIMPRGRREGWSGPRIVATPGGTLCEVCSAQVNKAIDCNTCGRCAAHKPGPPVAFVQHR